MLTLKVIRHIVIAIQFLTRIPLPKIESEESDIARSMRYFPLVGLLIGELLVLSNILMSKFVPESLVNIGLIIIIIIITGALHLDGFADTMDGIFCPGSRDKILAVMKDSRIGAIGVVGLILLLLSKFELLNNITPAVKTSALLLMPVMGRWSMVISACVLPYARSEGGTGKVFTERLKKGDLLVASIITFIIAGIFLKFNIFLFVVLNLALICLLLLFSRLKIGGITGDVMGCISEIVEIFVLFIFVVQLV